MVYQLLIEGETETEHEGMLEYGEVKKGRMFQVGIRLRKSIKQGFEG